MPVTLTLVNGMRERSPPIKMPCAFPISVLVTCDTLEETSPLHVLANSHAWWVCLAIEVPMLGHSLNECLGYGFDIL